MRSAFAMILTLSAPSPRAAAAPASSTLTWEACAAEAIAGNAEMRQARLAADAARLRRNAAFGGFLPRLSASLSASDSDRNRRLYFQDLNASWSARLSASQSLFSGFATLADVLRASASARREAERARQAEADLRARLRRAFTDVQFGQENVVVLAGIATRRRANAELVRLRWEGGREDQGSVLRGEATAAEADLEAAQARRALGRARRRLARELGRDDPAGLAVTGDWTTAAPPADPDLGVLTRATSAVAQAAASRDEAAASLLAARSPFWPDVDASASIGRDDPTWRLSATHDWSAGLSASWNLFNGGRDAFGWRAAAAGERGAALELADTLRTARIGLEDALDGFRDATESLGVRTKFLAAARARAEIGRAQYANGRVGFQTWDDIESELVDAESRFVGARRDVLSAEAGWHQALGEGFPR